MYSVRKKVNCYNSTKTCQICLKLYARELVKHISQNLHIPIQKTQDNLAPR